MSGERKDVGNDMLDSYRLLRWLISKISYGIGNKIFPFMMSLSLVHLLFRGPLRRVQSFQRGLTGEGLTKKGATHFLLTNYLSFWRLQAIARISDEGYQRNVSISGIEHLERFYGKSGIVLCNSHFGAGKIVPIAIARAGYDVVSLDRLNILGGDHQACDRLESIELGRKSGTFHLKQLMRMKGALNNKKILHVVGDGYRGTSGKEYSFLGKKRPFRRSFAELAVTTDAAVIPVFSRVLQDGSIRIEIGEPLTPAAGTDDKEVKTDALCRQYVAILEHHWRSSPLEVHKNDMLKYLALHESSEGIEDAVLGQLGA